MNKSTAALFKIVVNGTVEKTHPDRSHDRSVIHTISTLQEKNDNTIIKNWQ